MWQHIDAFIEETNPKEDSKKVYPDYRFLRWIPYSHIKLIKSDPIAEDNYSKVFTGKLVPPEQGDEVVDYKELINIDIALKVWKESENLGSEFLNELKIHYKFLGVCAIPFYGVTFHPEMNEYPMIMKRAIHGDLRKFIDNSTLSWLERVKIISSIAKSLNELHNLDIIHRDLHCGNILVDDVDNDTKIFISDFGLSRTIDFPSKGIIGVLPYVAPEVLCGQPYMKKSDIYSLGTIMWELTSSESPFSDRAHDIDLAVEIVSKKLRPKIVEGTPEVYKNIMERCWNAEPSERPDLLFLINEYEELIKDPRPLQKSLRKAFWNPPSNGIENSEQANSSISECINHLQSNYVKSRSIPLITLEDSGQDDFSTYDSKLVNFSLSDVSGEKIADTNEDDTTYGSRYEFEFAKGDDFYIKTTASPSGHSSASSTQNYVVDVDRGFFVSWGADKEGSKVIIAQQKSTTEHDGYQLWHYDDGFLINKQTTLYLESETV
ncbi:kinase-like domain-containing protein [Gigaspora rosea]|uniref:Kinase-like domain-containing protein n=1 Tax=Gigaspora rosea TaxID=44941 RepID=A0A397UTV1_9GLOM|nr:kinase-like domain-containing protein [Gigaspora rosea]